MPDGQIDAAIDAALGRAPKVQIPAHFANQVLAALPRSPASPAPHSSTRLWPALTLAGGATAASLGWAAIALGWTQSASQPPVLAILLGIESSAALAWIWRQSGRARQ